MPDLQGGTKKAASEISKAPPILICLFYIFRVCRGDIFIQDYETSRETGDSFKSYEESSKKF